MSKASHAIDWTEQLLLVTSNVTSKRVKLRSGQFYPHKCWINMIEIIDIRREIWGKKSEISPTGLDSTKQKLNTFLLILEIDYFYNGKKFLP